MQRLHNASSRLDNRFISRDMNLTFKFQILKTGQSGGILVKLFPDRKWTYTEVQVHLKCVDRGSSTVKLAGGREAKAALDISSSQKDDCNHNILSSPSTS